jgi:hypothetical protein
MNYDIITDYLKGHAWSFVTTFLTAFFGSLYLSAGTLPMDQAAVFAAIAGAARAGVKAVMQVLMSGQVGQTLGAKGRV